MSKLERNQWLKYFELKKKGFEEMADVVLDGIVAKWYKDKYQAESLSNLAHHL